MKKHVFQILCTLLISIVSQSQEPIDVTDQTVKIGAMKEEEIYLGFATGDKIIFNFKEINGKDVKEVEIMEYPTTSKFSDFKINKIENKTFTVLKQGVYVFRFKNSAISGRICKIQVQRIPGSDATKSFNTAVIWMDKQDTTWNTFTKDVVIGYDTVYEQKVKKELIKTEQREEVVIDKMQRVHSINNENGNKTFVFFTLPQNQISPNYSSKVVAWAYWIGVGEEANNAWKANMKLVQSAVKTGAAYFTTPIGALAIGVVVDLITPKLGEDVGYSLVDAQNKELFMSNLQYKGWDHGKGVAGYKKFSDPGLCQGTYFICMSNDNSFQGIDASVKVVAILETNQYQHKQYTDMVVTPRYEKQLFKDPIIKSYKAPVTGL